MKLWFHHHPCGKVASRFMGPFSRNNVFSPPFGTMRASTLYLSLRCITVLIACFLAAAVPASAQLTPLNKLAGGESKKGAEESAPAKESRSPEDLRSSATKQLKEAEALRDRDSLESAPMGISLAEQDERRMLVGMLITYLSMRLNSVEALDEAKAERRLAEQEARSSVGKEAPPPYSVLKLDELRDAADAVRVKAQGMESSLEILKNEFPRHQKEVQQAEEASRRALEEETRAKTPEDEAQATWRKMLADLRVRVATLAYANANLRAEVLAEGLFSARTRLTPLEAQVERVSKDIRFSQGDLNSVLQRLEAERGKLEKELKEVLDRNPQNVARRTRIQADLDRARAGKGPDDGHVRLLETRLRAVEAEIESNKVAGDVLTSLLTIYQGAKVLWQLRYEAYAGTDSEKRRVAYEQLRQSLERIRPWAPYTQRMLKVYRSQENDQEQRLATVLPADPARQLELEIRDSYHRRRVMYERLNNEIEGAERALLHWQKDFDVQRASRSFEQRLADWYAHLAYYARKVWNFELFAVEDTVEVAGQKVTTSRGVTIGKSLGAVILFLVGFLIVSFAGRRMQGVLVSRFSVDGQTANVLRRWVVALAVFLLIILTLNLARIPLTVFAFLGGALAIGVGFGTQTLIKNFISGILLLLERKVRVGDIVEVEGIVGRVTEVDIRSSTVQGFDGVETLIPNSSFLENKVTNWTYTSPQMRRALKIGVAYGSPVHTVSDVLMQCAARHGLILNDPEPDVLLEDFGDNSLIFALYFWIEMHPQVNALKVASDLRFMIEKQFGDKGITISYPQRDVHLDTLRPLKVQVVPEAQGTLGG